MKIVEKVLTDRVVDVRCDICGNVQKENDIANLSATWGYNSDKDGEEHCCDICEMCYNKVSEFIVSLGGKIQITRYL